MNLNELCTADIVPVALVAGRVVADRAATCWRAPIDRGKIVIFRGAFQPRAMVALRRALQTWASQTPAMPRGVSASQAGLNFHRLDDGTQPTSLAHIFYQFGIVDGPADGDASAGAPPKDLAAEVRAMRVALLDWQNQLAGTAIDANAPEFRFKAMRHPRGGGHLVSHRHPYLPQKVAIFLNLSEPGVDYASGCARFRNAAGWVDTHADFRCGDLLAWRYDLVHGITEVEPSAPLQWTGDDGLWIAAMEWIDSHPHSRTA